MCKIFFLLFQSFKKIIDGLNHNTDNSVRGSHTGKRKVCDNMGHSTGLLGGEAAAGCPGALPATEYDGTRRSIRKPVWVEAESNSPIW